MSMDDDGRDRIDWTFDEHRLSEAGRRRREGLERDLVARVEVRRSARRRRRATAVGVLLLAIVSGVFLLVDRGSVSETGPQAPRMVEAPSDPTPPVDRTIASSPSEAVASSGPRILVIDGVTDPGLKRPVVQVISQDRLLSILVDAGVSATIRCDDAGATCELALLETGRS